MSNDRVNKIIVNTCHKFLSGRSRGSDARTEFAGQKMRKMVIEIFSIRPVTLLTEKKGGEGTANIKFN